MDIDTDTNGRDPAVAQALLRLDEFGRRILPMAVARLARWRGCHRNTRLDLLEELRQELALDCLQYPTQICGLTTPQRHKRWFRLLHRAYYRLFTARRRARGFDVWTAPAHDGEPWNDRTATRLHGLPAVQDLLEVDRHASGRANLDGTARRRGGNPRRLRQALRQLAALCGHDREFLDFWRHRTAEALVGLAADLLQQGGPLSLYPRRRRLPDPEGRLYRLGRIRALAGVQPLPADLRRALSLPRLQAARSLADAHRLLLQAEELAPRMTSLWAWQFEAAIATGDAREATRVLRRERRLRRGDRVAMVLARTRLLELRRRPVAAWWLLRRAALRWPGDRRLTFAMRGLANARRRPIPGRLPPIHVPGCLTANHHTPTAG
ncbi:MAG: hypothetical protein IPK26_17185 [Planctomycetes bacterium]|nr:hypothetical protein [Planctomycetota bacterium]